MRDTLLRALLNGFVLAGVVWLPWWGAVLAALPLLARFRAYEVVLWGAVADALYAAPISLTADLPVFYTLVFFLVFVAAEYGKRFLVFY